MSPKNPNTYRRGNYEASPAWLRKHGLKAEDAVRLEQAMCTLIDLESKIVAAGPYGTSPGSVVDAIRHLIDGPDR